MLSAEKVDTSLEELPADRGNHRVEGINHVPYLESADLAEQFVRLQGREAVYVAARHEAIMRRPDVPRQSRTSPTPRSSSFRRSVAQRLWFGSDRYPGSARTLAARRHLRLAVRVLW